MKKLILYFFLCSNSIVPLIAEEGSVIVPVADCVGTPIRSFKLAKNVEESYKKLPLCGVPTSSQGCPRIQQLLFNEPIHILKKDATEVCIQADHLRYVTHTNKTPQTLYWLPAASVISVSQLQEKNIPLHQLPSASSHTIALLCPWYDPQTNKTYSAGTCFAYDPALSTAEYYTIFVLDWAHQRMLSAKITKSMALVIEKNISKQAARKKFLMILRSWIQQPGYICYVWGGSSLIKRYKENSFAESAQHTRTAQKNMVYIRPEGQEIPKTGFDCAGLVVRAAQLAGIPFYYKNTYTMAHYLKSLTPDQRLQEGDLIWIPGHIMIVSDLAHNKLIEARGYSHGFGIVQEIELHKVFQGIYTYKDLMKMFHEHRPLARLNVHGVPVETIRTFKMLSLNSAWEAVP